jgi:GTP cyclohydrolase I
MAPHSPLLKSAENGTADSLGHYLSDEEKISKIKYHFAEIMQTLGLDLSDDSLKDTPYRVASMYVNEIFSGLDPKNYPPITTFKNKYGYHEMLIQKNIQLYSYCALHFMPIIGKVHCAYIPGEKVIGLSKINRLVQFFSRRPHLQSGLTTLIGEGLQEALQTEDVAVYIQAEHLCVASTGIKCMNSSAVTNFFGGVFSSEANRIKFFSSVLNQNVVTLGALTKKIHKNHDLIF